MNIPIEFRLSRAEREAGLNSYPLYMFDNDVTCKCGSRLRQATQRRYSTHCEAYCPTCGISIVYDTPLNPQKTWAKVKHIWQSGVPLERALSL